MDKNKFAQAGVDLEDGVARCVGSEDFYKKMLAKFLENDSFEKLKAALDRGQTTEGFEAAHALKGLAGNLGMTRLGEADSKLTEALRGEGNIQTAKSLFPAVEKAYKEVVALLKTI